MASVSPHCKTSIIWTCEVSSMPSDPVPLIAESKVECIRLITRPSDLDDLKRIIQAIHNRPAELKQHPLTLMVDLFPDDLITFEGSFDSIDLGGDEEVEVAIGDSSAPYYISSQQPNIAEMFNEGQAVYLGLGEVLLTVTGRRDNIVTFKVVHGGSIPPGTDVYVPQDDYPNVIDEETLAAVGELDIDFLSLSGVRCTEDTRLVNEAIEKMTHKPWHLLKVNHQKVLENLQEYVPYVKGVILGRTELALSVGAANVPLITKEVIQTCNDHSLIIVMASDVLRSMRFQATPTRAEVSDIGNAVYDGADGVILSKDIALGPYSVRSIEVAQKTIEDVESHTTTLRPPWEKEVPTEEAVLSAVTYGAYRTAARNGAKALVCLTRKGNTALHLASYRADTPIIAVTYSRGVKKKLNLIRGVESLVHEGDARIDDLLEGIDNLLKTKTWLKPGDKYVFVSVSLSQISKESSNLFTIQTIH